MPEDRVRELAEAGYTAAAIAEELGISRQRVYQLAHKYHIHLPSGYVRVVPKARLFVSGGENALLTPTSVGTVSELMVAADLIARGWQPYFPIVRDRGYDLIATYGAKIVTIEVRSGRKNIGGKVTFSKNQRKYPSEYFGIVVAGESVKYEPELPKFELPELING